MINEAGGRRALVVAPRLTQWRTRNERGRRSSKLAKLALVHFQRNVGGCECYRARTTVYYSPFLFRIFHD